MAGKAGEGSVKGKAEKGGRPAAFSAAQLEAIERLVDSRIRRSLVPYAVRKWVAGQPPTKDLAEFELFWGSKLHAELAHPMRAIRQRTADGKTFPSSRIEADVPFDLLADLLPASADVPSDTLDDLRTAMRIGGREAVIDANLARNRQLIDELVGTGERDE
jgi:hypothetical protein